MNINRTQSLNGMTIVGQKQEDVNIAGGIENESGNKTGEIENENVSIFVKKEQQILENASKSAYLDTYQIEQNVLTWLPSVLGVLMTGIIFSMLMLILLVKKHRNKILLHEDKNLLPQH